MRLRFTASTADGSGGGFAFQFQQTGEGVITRRTFTTGAATMLAAGHLSTRGFVLLLTLFPGIVTILPRMLYG